MGLPNQFNDIIHSHLNVHAAWLPMAQIYELGDYGIISDGVFAKLGNISEFNVSFTSATGPETAIDYTSASTTVTKFAAGAQVDVIPAGAINAKVVFKFNKEKSFLIKSPVITVSAISNVQQVANQLKKAAGWKNSWKVVYETYRAQEAVVISTIDAGTEIAFSGEASALKDLKLGSAGIEYATSKKLGLDIRGKNGILGLGLFKLKLFGNGPSFMGEDASNGPDTNGIEYLNDVPLESDL
jgi:hypothetical protein